MNLYEQQINLLGLEAKDKVTGFTGTISTVSFDLYGCIQVVLSPKVNQEGRVPDSHWFDVTRLSIFSEKRVMSHPDFNKGYIAEGKKGPAEKPVLN